MTALEKIEARTLLSRLPAEALLNTAEAAIYLNCKPQTLAKRRCEDDKLFPFVRNGRSVLYRKGALDEALGG